MFYTILHCCVCELTETFFFCLFQVCVAPLRFHGCLVSFLIREKLRRMMVRMNLNSSTERLCCSLVKKETPLWTHVPSRSWWLVRHLPLKVNRQQILAFYCLLFHPRIKVGPAAVLEQSGTRWDRVCIASVQYSGYPCALASPGGQRVQLLVQLHPETQKRPF